LSEELSSLNLYNVLADCASDPDDDTTAAGASAAAQRKQRLADVLRTHRHWPVTGVVPQHGQRVHNWATLLGHNPPCTVAT
jgi:hypothetical protein